MRTDSVTQVPKEMDGQKRLIKIPWTNKILNS